MATRWLGRTTESVADPGWSGSDFLDPDAQRMWQKCPTEVQRIVRAEAEAGNSPWNILINHECGIILVALPGPPLSDEPTSGFVVHRTFSLGNYCYEGAVCTYEHEQSGCFISFEDPTFEGPPLYGSGA